MKAHPGEVGRDQEQCGSLEARRYRMPQGYGARHDRAIDRRDDVGTVEIYLRRVERGPVAQ